MGTIYSAPYDSGGADVEIRPIGHGSATPWFCGCERLEAAFFAAAVYTGPGWQWTWARRPSMDTGAVLHCFLDLKTTPSGEASVDLDWGLDQISSRNLIPCSQVADAVRGDCASEVVADKGGSWFRWQVTFACRSEIKDQVRLGQVYRDASLRLVVVSVTQ